MYGRRPCRQPGVKQALDGNDPNQAVGDGNLDELDDFDLDNLNWDTLASNLDLVALADYVDSDVSLSIPNISAQEMTAVDALIPDIASLPIPAAAAIVAYIAKSLGLASTAIHESGPTTDDDDNGGLKRPAEGPEYQHLSRDNYRPLNPARAVTLNGPTAGRASGPGASSDNVSGDEIPDEANGDPSAAAGTVPSTHKSFRLSAPGLLLKESSEPSTRTSHGPSGASQRPERRRRGEPSPPRDLAPKAQSKSGPDGDETDYRGVKKKGNRFEARYGKDGKDVYLGMYATAKQAAVERDNAVRAEVEKGAWKGPLPRYNFPQGQEYGMDMTGVRQNANGKFRAEHYLQGKTVHIGTFTTREEAAAGYRAAVKKRDAAAQKKHVGQ